MSYWRFATMIATSTVTMFVLMYLNTFALGHVDFSETRVYMAIVMGAAMAAIMLGFMWSMYKTTSLNLAIFAGSAVVFALALFLVRSQVTVGQVSYMRAMIPHHSIAIMTSSRAAIADPRVRELADGIIAAQEREIAEMYYLIDDLEGERAGSMQAPPEEAAPVGSWAEALERPMLNKTDPEGLSDRDIAAALPGEAGCRFFYTATGEPVLVTRPGSPPRGIVKLRGMIVPLSAQAGGDLADGAVMNADGVQITVTPVGGQSATLMLEIEQGRTIGYRGIYRCTG